MKMSNLDSVFDIAIRTVVPNDLGYCIDTYENALRPYYTMASRADFSHAIKTKLNTLLAGDGSILVAVPPTDTQRILGWILFDATAVHFVYVRNTHRGIGVARRLVTKAGHAKNPIPVTQITNTLLLISHKFAIQYLPII